MPKIVEEADLFRAVMQVVVERGYAGATTKQMAEAANVSEVTLFRKYESKLQLVKQAISALIEQTDFEAATQYTGDIEADLLRVVQTYQASAVRHGQFFAVLFSEFPRYPELAESIDKPLSIFYKIEQLFLRYQEEGRLSPEPTLYAVAALLGPLMHGTMMQGSIPGNSLPPIDLHKHVSFFLKGRAVS